MNLEQCLHPLNELDKVPVNSNYRKSIVKMLDFWLEIKEIDQSLYDSILTLYDNGFIISLQESSEDNEATIKVEREYSFKTKL